MNITAMQRKCEDAGKQFGYLAVFNDNDIRKHMTDIPKTHCVRVQLADWERWQGDPHIPDQAVVSGLQLHKFYGYGYVYEWFQSEHNAVRRVKKSLAMTQRQHYWRPSETEHRLNVDQFDKPYYAEVAIVSARAVWENHVTVAELPESPRLILPTETPLHRALALSLETQKEKS